MIYNLIDCWKLDVFYFIYKNSENGKIAPVGFPGTGVLAVPFFFMGNLIDEYFNPAGGGEVLNYTLLFYSLSPIVYFFVRFSQILDC